MRRFQIKNWIHKNHLANRRELALEIKHMYHDEAFWTTVIVALVVFAMILLFAFSFWASTHPAPTKSPFFPYI